MSKKIYLSPSSQINNIYAYGNTNEMVQCNKIAEAAKKIKGISQSGYIPQDELQKVISNSSGDSKT